MHTQDKVIAPRILQPGNHRYLVTTLLVLSLMLLSAWGGFELGRQWDRHIYDANPLLGLDAASPERPMHATLPPEPQASSEQAVAPVAVESESLVDVSREVAVETESGKSESQTPDPAETTEMSVSTGTTESDSDIAGAGFGGEADHQQSAVVPAEEPRSVQSGPIALQIRDFTLSREDADGIRCSFTVTHDVTGADLVTGSIWIAVDGRRNGKPVRLRLREITDSRSSFVPMRFEQFQKVSVSMQLPEDFSPLRAIVEVKPLLADKFEEASNNFDWQLAASGL